MITKDRERNLLRITDEITYEGSGVKNDFREKMLLNNHIEGLLEFRINIIDHEKVYEYNTEGLGTLESLTDRESIKGAGINAILREIAGIILRGANYMLDETDFILDPKYIYIDKNYHPKIAYYSGYRHPFAEQIMNLSEYLMNRVDYHDGESVLTVYTVYMKSREEGFGVKELISFLEGDTEKSGKVIKKDKIAGKYPPETKDKIYTDNTKNIPIISNSHLFDDKDTDTFEKVIRKTDKVSGSSKLSICIISAAGFFVIVTALALKFNLLLGKDRKPDILRVACLLLIGAAGGLYIFRYLYGKERKNNKKTVTPVVEEATELLFDGNDMNVHDEYRLVSDSDPEIRISHFPFYIGKDERHNDFCLNSTGVSRRHLKLEKISGEIYISDMNSTNGSYVNGEQLAPDKPFPLTRGAEIIMGRCRYRFESAER